MNLSSGLPLRSSRRLQLRRKSIKPPPFDYVAPSTLPEALAVLASDEDAKVIAGGQSLLPLLALRLARPTVLVDLDGLGLDGVYVDPPGPGALVRLGAMVRQRRIELDPDLGAAVPLLVEAVRHVGYVATRNRGTLGGSLAHADPVAELPAVVVALGGTVVAVGPSGSREVVAADLAESFFTTTLAPDEVLTEIRLPRCPELHGAAWCEWSPRAHDFATAGVGVAVDLDRDGTCVAVRAAACGVGSRPVSIGDALAGAGLVGADRVTSTLLDATSAAVIDRCGDLDDEDRIRLAGLLAARAARTAMDRALLRLREAA
jgi:carbon-monoxide dehydrogenase medium subunit